MTAPAAQASSPAADTSLAAQAAIAAKATGLLRLAWPQLDVASLDATLPQFKMHVAAITRRFGQAAASGAMRFYLAQRAEAGVPGRPSLRVAQPAPLEQVGKTVDWATRPLQSPEPDIRAAEQRLSGAVEKLVLDTGRDTIIGAARQDRRAKGWARVPEAGCCSFCALLATRGAVYKQDTVGFRSHDHCRCHAEPVFTAYEPSARIREWQALYSQVKHGSPAEMRAEFRRLFEQRT